MRQCKIGTATTSCFGVGAMSFAEFYGPTTEANSFAIMDAAVEAGVTHIDTSNVYGMGRSETAIGLWLAQNPGARDGLHIATKGGINRTGQGAEPYDNSPEHLEAQLDGSLKRLGVDCVDLYYVHRREHERPIEEVAETMAALVAKGKCKSIGFSEIAPASLRRAHAVHPVAAVQSEYSLASRFAEMGLVQTCAELGVALVAFSPVMRSMLTDSPIPPEVVPSLPFLKTNPRFITPNYAANRALSDRFRALAAELGVPAAALAVAWVLHRGEHIVPIPGTRSTEHFAQLVQGTQITLSDADMTRIETVLPIGWAHGARYSYDQMYGPENFC